jgi:hypothetical protein
MSIFEDEIESVIKKLDSFKAAGSDGISFFVLKCLKSTLVSYLQPLFQVCINRSYHPTAFCHCNTVPLRKPGKDDYSAPRAWRQIALLNTLGKVLENVIARRISTLSWSIAFSLPSTWGPTPASQMTLPSTFFSKRSMQHGRTKYGVATLLSLDMTGAFDRVVPARLLHNMREIKFPEWILN